MEEKGWSLKRKDWRRGDDTSPFFFNDKGVILFIYILYSQTRHSTSLWLEKGNLKLPIPSKKSIFNQNQYFNICSFSLQIILIYLQVK